METHKRRASHTTVWGCTAGSTSLCSESEGVLQAEDHVSNLHRTAFETDLMPVVMRTI